MKDFIEHISEAKGSVKWVRPKVATLRQEYEIEYKKHLVHDLGKDVFPTVDSFLKAAKEGIVRTITRGHDYYIRNRSHSKSMGQLLSLIKTYRSYPKYRNEYTLEVMRDRMLNGGEMDMPILVRERAGKVTSNSDHYAMDSHVKEIASGKRDRVFSGNTRMDIAFMHGIEPKALIIFLPEGVTL